MTLGLGDLAFVGSLGGITDPDAQAYITAVETADGQALETAVRDAINAFVIGCKADGIWPAIKACCIMAGARTLAGALVPLVGPAPTNFNFVAGDYNRKTGLLGDGITKHLNSNRNNNADPQNSQHLSVFPTTVNTLTVNRAYIGVGFLDAGSTYFATRDADSFSRNRSGSADIGLTRGPAGALIAVSRESSSSYIYRQGGSSAIIARASSTPFDGNIFVYQSNGGQSGAVSDARLAFYSIGENLDLALLDARITTLINAFAAAIP
jgi:hypothetical protein